MPKYIQKGKYGANELEGEWIILNTDEYTVTKINEVGGYCWSLLNEIQTVESLTAALMQNFSSEAPISQVKQDVEKFLTNLLQCGLIEHVD